MVPDHTAMEATPIEDTVVDTEDEATEVPEDSEA